MDGPPGHTSDSCQNQDLTASLPEVTDSGTCAVTAMPYDIIPYGSWDSFVSVACGHLSFIFILQGRKPKRLEG